MKLFTEKTPLQKISKFSLENVYEVNVVHLPIHDLMMVAHACDDLNQQAGSNKAVPHVAARNIKSKKELQNFIKFCKLKNIEKSLIIGGSIPRKETNLFQNAIDVVKVLKNENMIVDCGIYPQSETEIEIKKN